MGEISNCDFFDRYCDCDLISDFKFAVKLQLNIVNNVQHSIRIVTLLEKYKYKSLKSITFGRGSTVIFVFFLFCREDYNGITTLTELLNFTGKIYLFCINKKLYFFSQLLKYYMLHGLIYSFLRIWDFKNKWEMC